MTEDQTTAVLASPFVAHATAERVEVVWEIAAARTNTFAVERRIDTGGWLARGGAVLEGSHRVRFTDPAPPLGRRLRYRLATNDAGRRVTLGEVDVFIPVVPILSLTLRGGGGGSTGAWRAIVTLPAAAEVSLTIVDAQGRHRETLGPNYLGSGQHELPLDSAGQLPPGVYWVRMRSGGETRVARAVRVE